MHRKKLWFKIPLITIIVMVFLAVFGYLVMFLWNALVPEIFHGPALTFWQAVGLLVLAKIFLGGCPHKRSHHGWHHGWDDDRRKKFEEKLAAMSPEEREKFEAKWKEHYMRCEEKYDSHFHSGSTEQKE